MVSKDICSVADVATGDVGSYDLVDATGTSIKIALIHTENDRWFAIHDRCSHGRIALSEGFVEGESIECARHGALFDLATGNPLSPPATVAVKTYPVTIQNDRVCIELAAQN